MSVATRERGAQAPSLPAPTLEWAPPRGLEVPPELPVRSLSASSLQLAERCMAKWKAQYIDGQRMPQNLKMTCGKAFGATMAFYFAARIKGEPEPSPADLDDRLLAEFGEELVATVVGSGEDPEDFRESCREPLRAYATEIAPTLRPVAIERQVRFRFPDCEWSVSGYLDLELEDDEVADFKLGAKHVDRKRLTNDPQVTSYVLAKRLEGAVNPRFSFHSGRRGVVKTGPRWKVLAAPRTETQLLALQYRIARVARQIVAAAESGDWTTNPDGFWCSAKDCPAWSNCLAGGLE